VSGVHKFSFNCRPCVCVCVCVCAGIYLTMVMAMAALSIIVCVIVLDLHHRNSNTPVPGWVRWLLFGRLSRCLGFPVRCHELLNPQVSVNDRRWRSAAGDTAVNGRRRHRTTAGQDTAISQPGSDGTELEPRSRRQN